MSRHDPVFRTTRRIPRAPGSRHGTVETPICGDQNCYSCHADYGTYGTVLTKMGGMRRLWLYYTEYHGMSLETARAKIHLVKPFPNANGMHCHSTELQGWMRVAEHRSSVQDLRVSSA